MNFTKNRQIWFSFSAAAIFLSLVSILFCGFRLGLDFTGGARWQLEFSEKIEQKNLTDFFSQQKILTKKTKIQKTENGNFLVTIQDLPDAEIQKISQNLKNEVGEFSEISYQKVDSAIGANFQKKAILAILVALVGIILFVAFAFRKIPAAVNPWRFGAVAILALFHDIFIILGIFAALGFFLQIELDLQFITALLATLGFSVNDTIVILDRVRENIRTQKSHENFADTIEKSVRQTFARSINTSISTLLPLIFLLFFGAKSIFFFVFALICGILVGTYSSIFLAAPILVSWKNFAEKN